MKKKKSLAFLLFSMTGAGEERIASLLLRHMHADYNIKLVLFNGPIEYEIPDNIEVTYLRKFSNIFLIRAFSLPFVFFRYLKFCKRNNVEISISFDNVPNYINCLLKLFGWKGRVFIREVNFPSLRYRSGLKSMVHRFFIKWCYPKSDILFVNAMRIGDDLINNFAIPSDTIHLFNNPVDFINIKNQIESEVAKPLMFTCIHVGAFRAQKNHRLLINAFTKLKNLNVQLWLLGKGPLEADIREQINFFNLQDQVKILGFQSNPYKYMGKADCMVLTSDFEGLPNVLIEGMACGLPIVSTDSMSGPREMIVPLDSAVDSESNQIQIGKYGILSPVENSDLFAKAIEEIYTNKQLYKKIKESLKERIKEFEIKHVISNQLEEHLS